MEKQAGRVRIIQPAEDKNKAQPYCQGGRVLQKRLTSSQDCMACAKSYERTLTGILRGQQDCELCWEKVKQGSYHCEYPIAKSKVVGIRQQYRVQVLLLDEGKAARKNDDFRCHSYGVKRNEHGVPANSIASSTFQQRAVLHEPLSLLASLPVSGHKKRYQVWAHLSQVISFGGSDICATAYQGYLIKSAADQALKSVTTGQPS